MSRHVRSIYQTPRYREEWEDLPSFKGWLTKGPEIYTNQRSGATTKAYCTFCEDVVEPLYDSLMAHSESKSHRLVARARNASRHEEDLHATLAAYLRMRKDFSMISTQVIDSMTGLPAEGLDIKLYKHNPMESEEEQWEMLSRGFTDSDGYLDSLIIHTPELPTGMYKLEYLIQEFYSNGRRLKTTYPMVQPSFEVKEGMTQYHFRVVIAPHYHQVYLDTEKVKPTNGNPEIENVLFCD